MHKTLHILTKSNIPEAVLKASPHDGIILIREAIYLAHSALSEQVVNRDLFVLEHDWLARCGVLKPTNRNIRFVSADQFITLCCEHKQIITW